MATGTTVGEQFTNVEAPRGLSSTSAVRLAAICATFATLRTFSIRTIWRSPRTRPRVVVTSSALRNIRQGGVFRETDAAFGLNGCVSSCNRARDKRRAFAARMVAAPHSADRRQLVNGRLDLIRGEDLIPAENLSELPGPRFRQLPVTDFVEMTIFPRRLVE